VRLVVLTLVLAACHQGSTLPAPVPLGCAAGRVGKVTIDGGTKADVPELAVLEGTLDDPERTERIITTSKDLLNARGYSRATIAIERQQGCGVELAVHVDRGPRFRLARVRFLVHDEFPAKARFSAIEDALGTVNAAGGTFVADRLDRALEGLKHQYMDAGWLDVAIDPPRTTYDDDGGKITLTIPIHAGKRYKLGHVVARGGERSTRVAVLDALGLHGGDWYDGRVLRSAVRRTRRALGERIEVRLDFEDGTIDLEAVLGGAK
jgi:outer membrane protein assembly factor BamA